MHLAVERVRALGLAASLTACTAMVDRVGGPSHVEGGAGHGGATAGNGGSASVVTAGGRSSDRDGAAGTTGSSGAGGASGGSVVDDAGSGHRDGAVDAQAIDARGVDAGRVEGGTESDGGFVGPFVPPDCPGDPTAGWTEYADTFHIEHPYDLMVSDRYTFQNGIHTFWIFPTDKPHEVGNTTAPRTEAHWTNFTTGQRMWTADVLVDSPSDNTTIFQVHTTASGAGPVYIRVENGTVQEINGSVIARGVYDKWFNLKVAFESATSSATIYVNNCQKLVMNNSRPGSRNFYFKNGVYTCDSSICRDHYKNIHLYQK